MIARLLLSAVLVLASTAAAAQLSGKLVSTGSDTLAGLSSLWAQAVMRAHPGVTVQVRALGSSSAPTALIEGTTDIGPMSRPMSAAEQRAFERRYGYAATAIPVAVDRLAVFVHRENPLLRLTREQLDAVFSANRRCGGDAAVRSWGELGLAGPWEHRPIVRYGRGSTSGTYGFFRRQLLCGGDFAPRVNRLVGTAAVVRAVGDDVGAIGYGSAGFLSDSVRALRVDDGRGGEYDLARDLTLYVNLAPGAALPDLLRAYLRAALDDQGQREVRAAGYTALSAARRDRLWRELGLGAMP